MTTDRLTTAIDTVRAAYAVHADRPDDTSGYSLATTAGVAAPDSLTSPGARWLVSMFDALLDDVANGNVAIGDGSDASNYVTENADSAVPVHTHERFVILVDLVAYQEDVSELVTSGDATMEEQAGVALFMVAERLLAALVGELDEAYDATASDDDEDDQ